MCGYWPSLCHLPTNLAFHSGILPPKNIKSSIIPVIPYTHRHTDRHAKHEHANDNDAPQAAWQRMQQFQGSKTNLQMLLSLGRRAGPSSQLEQASSSCSQDIHRRNPTGCNTISSSSEKYSWHVFLCLVQYVDFTNSFSFVWDACHKSPTWGIIYKRGIHQREQLERVQCSAGRAWLLSVVHATFHSLPVSSACEPAGQQCFWGAPRVSVDESPLLCKQQQAMCRQTPSKVSLISDKPHSITKCLPVSHHCFVSTSFAQSIHNSGNFPSPSCTLQMRQGHYGRWRANNSHQQ